MIVQTKTEERWNSFTHAAGALLALIGLFILLFFDTKKTGYSTLSIVIFSLSGVALFLASAIYHWVEKEPLKTLWRKLDHIGIYLLIAGTYTPVALITLEKHSGWLIFWVVWGIAIAGSILKLFFTGRFEILSLLLYLFMGWLIVFDFKTLMANTTSLGLLLMLLGGGFYTLGTLFYSLKKMPYHHVVWHFFVLGGFLSHFFFILFGVI